MATMRNLYLNYIRAHPFLKRFDVLAVADLDLHYVTVLAATASANFTYKILEKRKRIKD